MSRARIGDGLLALVAVAAVVAPIHALLTPASWIPLALFLGLAVSLTGMVARVLTRRDALVVLWQIGVGVLLTSWTFGRGHLWYGLPSWETVLAFNDLLYEARMTITTYAPPAPTGAGITFGMALIAWITVLVVDFFAVTRRSPAVAGIPLFAAFLVPASNSGSGMAVWYFLAAAVSWLALLGRAGVLTLSRWDGGSRRGPAAAAGRAGPRRLAASGRTVGVCSVLVAVLVAALLPHLPTRFLLDGLGRATDGTGSTGNLTISSTVNLSRSLESQSTAPLIRFRTTASSAAPLRIAVLRDYSDGVWTLAENEGFVEELPGAGATEDEPIESVEVLMNGLGAPQLALPFPASALTIDTSWRSRDDGTVVVDRRVDSYEVDYVAQAPAEDILQAAPRVPSDLGPVSEADLWVDGASQPAVVEILDTIIEPGMSAIDRARAIQAHLRGTAYSYSVDLAGPAVDEAGNEIVTDPITHFLLTRQGYCVQFAAAMVMMARTEGIPARYVIGFLPGTAGSDGERTVVGADAHAWPELFFEGVGWLRFEPTPGTRSGSAPDYTRAGYGDGTALPTPTPGATAPLAPGAERPFEPPIDDPLFPDGTSEPRSPVMELAADYGWLALVVLIGALGAATMPLSAWWERRRRRRAAADDDARVEVIWQDLLERLDDVGVTPPPDASPRAAGTYIWGRTFLTQESRGALRRLVSAVEQARYAPPVTGIDPERVATMERDAQTVSENVVGGFQRSDRVRATWWPTAGVTAWRRLGAGLRERLERRSR